MLQPRKPGLIPSRAMWERQRKIPGYEVGLANQYTVINMRHFKVVVMATRSLKTDLRFAALKFAGGAKRRSVFRLGNTQFL